MKAQPQAIAIENDDEAFRRRLLDFDFFLLCLSIALFGNAVVEFLNISGF